MKLQSPSSFRFDVELGVKRDSKALEACLPPDYLDLIIVFSTGDIFVLVFGMDSRESFDEVIRLREQILETKASATSGNSRGKRQVPRVPMAIAGNKCDKDVKYV